MLHDLGVLFLLSTGFGQGGLMSKDQAANQGQVQGMIVKVKPQGDKTLRFDVVCRNSKGREAHREEFILSKNDPLQMSVQKGRRACITFERRGRRFDRPLTIVLL
jgi:hypothetical protein